MNADPLTAPPPTAAPSARTPILLALAVLLPLIAHALLFAANVPLGKPNELAYPYSEFVTWRARSLPAALLIGALFGWCILRAFISAQHARRNILLAMFALGFVLLGVWSYTAPPAYRSQHFFNMTSPSQDGAFLLESYQVDNIHDYLATFPARARTPEDVMRGTRVISNPPGATLLALATQELLTRWPTLFQMLERNLGDQAPDAPAERIRAVFALAYAWALTALWVLAAPLLYLAARLYLPPISAAVFAVVTLCTPMTLLFTPGKDPAQLLTTAIPLVFWLLAVRRGWWLDGVFAGLTAALACVASLVHVWVAAALVFAALWHAARTRTLPTLLNNALITAVGGFVIGALLLYWVSGYNLLASSLAVAQSQSEVTRGPDAMPFLWQALGLPLFLLFAGPALWFAALSATTAPRESDADAAFGRRLLLITAAILLATVGFTNLETPRLWIPFVPLLTLALFLHLPLLRRPAPSAAALLAALVFLQVAASAAHWSLMDMRETELRIRTDNGRMYN